MGHEGIRTYLQSLIGKSWRFGPAVTPGEILKAETMLGVSFPEDYREFLQMGGLRQGGEAFRGMWQVKDMVSLNQSMPVFKRFKGIVGIGNEGFMVYAFDFRYSPPPVVSLGLSSSDWADITVEAATFEKWLRDSLGG